jgi:DNA-binding GntR family transcriptional regulator
MKEHLYAKVARHLADGMASGRYPLGSLLPTELELSRQYGTSRQTIRAAMRELQNLGLVSRRKHVGTRVEASQSSGTYNQTIASLDDLVQLAATHTRVVRGAREVIADRDLAKELRCAPGTRWLHLSTLRLERDATNEPLCWTDTYVDAAFSELAELVPKFPKVLISSLIETHYGRATAEVEQDLHAVTLPAALARDLDAPPNSPAMKVLRRYLDMAGRPLQISVSIYPGDRFTFSMKLKRAGNSAG